MSPAGSRVEAHKLAHDLGVEPEAIDYLEVLPATELATLRAGVSKAIFAATEKRISPLGALARRVPANLAARVARTALGPLLSGRVASVMDPKTAVALASHLDSDFLAQVTLSLDPQASAAIIRELDEELVIGVGVRLLEAGEHMVLARFITVVDERVVLALAERADGSQLLRIALYADDDERVQELLQLIPRHKLEAVREAAGTDPVDPEAAASLISRLGAELPD